jgi:hypothetical protein
MTIILTVFVEGYQKREIETRQFLESISASQVFKSNRLKIQSKTVERSDIYSYPEMIKFWWGKEDLILLEHDVSPTIDQFLSLLSCSRPVCNFDYQIPVSKTEYTILHMGLGLSKFSVLFQKRIDIEMYLANQSFMRVDYAILSAMQSLNQSYHSHGEVKHNHRVEDLTEDFKLRSF